MIDITRYLDANTVAWPGDTLFSSEQSLSIERGNAVNLSSIKTSVHNGTHADAPWHFDRGGATIDQVALAPYIGPCIVLDATEYHRIEGDLVRSAPIQKNDRVLFKTRSRQADEWREDNTSLTLSAVIALSATLVKLVGTEEASVDKTDSKELTTHHALNKHGIMILENLNLCSVDPGRYVLVALPLKLRGLDASPVRAVLYSFEEWESILH